MTPLFVVLIVGFIVFRALGLVVPWFADWEHCLRAALGLMFLLTASAHWGKRRPDLVRMVPSYFRRPEVIVTLTGIAELATAIGLQIPRVALFTAVAAILMLIAMFPANIKAARERLTILNKPVASILPRTLGQIVFIALLAASVWRR
jgi:uncharacterized membrane protein